jgi:hypothetical protein
MKAAARKKCCVPSGRRTREAMRSTTPDAMKVKRIQESAYRKICTGLKCPARGVPEGQVFDLHGDRQEGGKGMHGDKQEGGKGMHGDKQEGGKGRRVNPCGKSILVIGMSKALVHQVSCTAAHLNPSDPIRFPSIAHMGTRILRTDSTGTQSGIRGKPYIVLRRYGCCLDCRRKARKAPKFQCKALLMAEEKQLLVPVVESKEIMIQSHSSPAVQSLARSKWLLQPGHALSMFPSGLSPCPSTQSHRNRKKGAGHACRRTCARNDLPWPWLNTTTPESPLHLNHHNT